MYMDKKIFIVTTDLNTNIAKKLALEISNIYDFTIADNFSSDESAEITYNIEDIILAFKNNALLYCYVKDNVTYGITIDEFYNKDIFCVPLEGFINIADNKLLNTIIIWIDAKYENNNEQLNNIDYMESLLSDKNDCLYFTHKESMNYVKESIMNFLDNSYFNFK